MKLSWRNKFNNNNTTIKYSDSTLWIKLELQSIHTSGERIISKSRDFEHLLVERETLGDFLDMGWTFFREWIFSCLPLLKYDVYLYSSWSLQSLEIL